MLTVPQLQPQPGDPAPSIVCREVDPPDDEFPTGLAVFRCGKCGFWTNVEFDPNETNPATVRGLAIQRHQEANSGKLGFPLVGRCP